MRNYKKISLVIVCIASLSMFSQKVKEAKADKSYDKFAYVDAIKTYERVVAKGYKSQDLLQKLGNAYYFKADLVKAAKWYGELFTFSQNIEPEYYYRYSQSLKEVNDYAKADDMMAKFKELKGTDLRAILAINQKDYLARIKKNSGRYKVENAGINSKYSDFGSAFLNNKIVFASARDTGSFSNRRHSWTGEGFTNLYKADIIAEGTLYKAEKFSSDINSKVNESSPVFTKDGKTVYFTRNNFINGKLGKDTEKTTLLKLYKATLEGEKWTNIKEMPFNSNNYSVAHPALSADESTLYFASDMPGTLGQSDLYKIAINLDGSFGAPTNLGNKINTEGRETFPMVTSDGELYFASDGHPGLGGLDIFVSKMDKEGHFGEVVNVGEPVNSSYDDFAFLINDKTRYGYFTSNRLGGKGGDDIYKLKETQKLITKCEQNLSGLVTDKETGLPLADAKVTLLDADFKTLKEVMSDKDGKFDFGLKGCKTVFYIKVEKQEFAPTQTKAITIKEDESSYVEIPLEKPAQIIKKGDDLMKKFNITLIHFDLGKYNIRPDAEIELAKILDVLEQYPQMEIDIRSHTDSRQSAEKNRILSQNRASSTMEWLIKKGITQNRLTAKGYGESQLLNKCADGVKCSEEEHQANRRSEFIVTKI
ncbi:OmpA family protein [Flavobacterium sp.]|uniref:OmpA family protein n=1 Tax=Flavobacterium sp. TaxID=239 RepID=UPI0037C0062F